MNKELEWFENRNDDWLAKERKYETKISAWDIDEGKRIKVYHEKNCEAKQIKDTHEMLHQNRFNPKSKNESITLIPIILILIGVNIFQSVFFEDMFSLSPFIIFIIFIYIGIIIANKKGEK